MHVNHGFKGMDLAWDLSQVLKEPSEVAVKRNALNNWAANASQAILKTIADKQNEIKYNLEERIEDISAQTEMLEKAGVTMDQTFVAAMKTGLELLLLRSMLRRTCYRAWLSRLARI